jgi:DNA gyrase inhibitor GyrI
MKALQPLLILAAAASMLVQPLAAQETDGKKMPETVDKALDKGEISIVETKPFFYCALEMKGSYEQHTNGFMTMLKGAAQQGLPMDQTMFGVYWNSPENTPEEELKWEIGFTVPDDAEIKEPLAKKKWGYTHHVIALFEGAYDSPELGALYAAMLEWAGKNGYEPAGPCMERFVSAPAADDTGNFGGKVEVLIPVVKK